MLLEQINNRSENWKTARVFATLPDDRLTRLVKFLEGSPKTPTDEIRLQLHWKGVRDYCHGKDWGTFKTRLIECYESNFSSLRNDVENFGNLRVKNDDNYLIETSKQQDRLANNLRNTEIDIVIESSQHLFIGEAKNESSFHANGNLVLVHQLIRQYVMASILVDIVGRKKKIIPFVVCNEKDKSRIRNNHQFKFMAWKKWMNENHVLYWNRISTLG